MEGKIDTEASMFYADTSGGSLYREETSNDTTGWSKTATFSAFRVNVFGIFRNKANIVIHNYLDPRWLSADPKPDDIK